MLKETTGLPRGVELTATMLSFLAADDDRFSHFVGVTGHDLTSLREEAESPAFQEALLDYILDEDARVVAFAEFAGVRPEAIAGFRVAGEDGATSSKVADKLPLPPRRLFAE
ncbi:MAG TPA: DUF3572 family protein [Microvirga sp.]|jgi:hypothetical protein|nr:DUF3572 family protein [Microvirga sp.]